MRMIVNLFNRWLGWWRFRTYKPKTDAECYAWYVDSRMRPVTITDIAVGLYQRWGLPCQNEQMLGYWTRAKATSLYVNLAHEALRQNGREGSPREVDVVLEEWHSCAMREAAQAFFEHRSGVSNLIFGR